MNVLWRELAHGRETTTNRNRAFGAYVSAELESRDEASAKRLRRCYIQTYTASLEILQTQCLRCYIEVRIPGSTDSFFRANHVQQYLCCLSFSGANVFQCGANVVMVIGSCNCKLQLYLYYMRLSSVPFIVCTTPVSKYICMLSERVCLSTNAREQSMNKGTSLENGDRRLLTCSGKNN